VQQNVIEGLRRRRQKSSTRGSPRTLARRLSPRFPETRDRLFAVTPFADGRRTGGPEVRGVRRRSDGSDAPHVRRHGVGFTAFQMARERVAHDGVLGHAGAVPVAIHGRRQPVSERGLEPRRSVQNGTHGSDKKP